jgi:hypothetical protein
MIVEKIVKQGPGYYWAINKSAEAAQKGCYFAMDAIDFCQRLFLAKDSLETLQAGLENIKEIAKSAHQDSEDMHQQFRRIRVELFEVRFRFLTSTIFSNDSSIH